jgi:hypothetical protein
VSPTRRQDNNNNRKRGTVHNQLIEKEGCNVQDLCSAQYKDSMTDSIKVADRSNGGSAERSTQRANLVNNLFALLPRHVLAI